MRKVHVFQVSVLLIVVLAMFSACHSKFVEYEQSSAVCEIAYVAPLKDMVQSSVLTEELNTFIDTNCNDYSLKSERDRIDYSYCLDIGCAYTPGSEFVTMQNGTTVDARISSDVITFIYSYFDAIQNGDVMAFRDLLLVNASDNQDVYVVLSLIVEQFSEIVHVDSEIFIEAVRQDDEAFFSISHSLLNDYFPITRRNINMFIEKIELVDIDIPIIRATVVFDGNDIAYHYFQGFIVPST